MTHHWTRLIERYLYDELSSEMKLDFENELAQNTDLQTELDFHKDIEGAFQRNSDRSMIRSAQKKFAKKLLLKKIGIFSLWLLAIALIVWMFLKPISHVHEREVNTERNVELENKITKVENMFTDSVFSSESSMHVIDCIEDSIPLSKNIDNIGIVNFSPIDLVKNVNNEFVSIGVILEDTLFFEKKSDIDSLFLKGFPLEFTSQKKHSLWQRLFGKNNSKEKFSYFEAKMVVRGEKIVLYYSYEFPATKKYDFSFVTHTEKGEYDGNSWILKEDKRILANKSIRYEQEIPFKIDLENSYIIISIYEIKRNKKTLVKTQTVRITE